MLRRTTYTIVGISLICLSLLAYQQVQRNSQPLPVYGQMPEFLLTNQNAQPVTLDVFRGKVVVADIIYTRCPSQCIRMTYQMNQLQSALPVDRPIRLVSLTTDPEYDIPPVLKKYSLQCGAKENWIFLTGDKKTIGRVAMDGMKLSSVSKVPKEGEDPNDLFIHSTKFVLIDQQGQIRGYYEGETGSSRHQLLSDIKKLLKM